MNGIATEYISKEEYLRAFELREMEGLIELSEAEAVERSAIGGKLVRAGSWLKAKAHLGLPLSPLQLTLLQQQSRHHQERRALVEGLLIA